MLLNKRIQAIIAIAVFFLLAVPALRAEEKTPAILEPISQVHLGKGWATNTVNTVIFRRHALLTSNGYQFGSFYDVSGNLVLIRRHLVSGVIERHIINDKFNVYDAHNSISLGIDPKGYLHMSYDMHASPLRYRKSLSPYDITAWTDELAMTGKYEDQVTYPMFVHVTQKKSADTTYEALLFFYRHRGAGNGDVRIKRYLPDSDLWVDYEFAVLKGTGQKPWTANPYLNQPAVTVSGKILLSYTWRLPHGPTGIVENRNLAFAASNDIGETWETALGHPLRLPITPVNSATIMAIAPGVSLTNQTGSAVDSAGRLHIVYRADDEHGVPQFKHLWFDGAAWQQKVLTQRSMEFDMKGKGTLRTPTSRPEIVIDDANNVYVIYRADVTGDRMAVQRLMAPKYIPSGDIRILWNEPLENAEPIIDRLRWESERVLSMLIQKTSQPPHDAKASVKAEPVYIVDWNLNEDW